MATKKATGKHHMFDFLPENEKNKFLERLLAVRSGKPLPADSPSTSSDYEQNKLDEQNKGIFFRIEP